MKKVVFLFVLFLFSKNLKAQSIPLGSLDFKDERLRNEQLLGKNKSENSFTIRPLLIENDSINTNKIQFSYSNYFDEHKKYLVYRRKYSAAL